MNKIDMGRVYRYYRGQGLVNSCPIYETCYIIMYFAIELHQSLYRYYDIMDLFPDRTWMARRKSNTNIGATAEFIADCQMLLDYAYIQSKYVNARNQIRCPCWKCKTNNNLD